MKELRNDSRVVRIGVYVCIACAVFGAIWYLYRAFKLMALYRYQMVQATERPMATYIPYFTHGELF